MTTPPDLDGQPLELLIKLMKMTAAEDNIALVAIRKANAHIAKLGTDWEALLRGKVKINIVSDPFANIDIPQNMNLNRNQPYRPPAPSRPQASPPPPPPSPPPKPNSQTTAPDDWGFGSPPRHNAPPLKARRPSVKPMPGNAAFAGDVKEKTIVNKYEGTCTKCKNRVLTGDGIAHLWKRPNHSTYWTTEHSGTCPTTRRFKPATTADDFQV